MIFSLAHIRLGGGENNLENVRKEKNQIQKLKKKAWKMISTVKGQWY